MLQYQGLELGEGPSRLVFEVDGLRVAVTVRIEAGTLRLTTLGVSGREVTSAALRRIPLGEIKKCIIAELRVNPALADGGALFRQLYRGSGDHASAALLARLDEAEGQAYQRVASLHGSEPHRGRRGYTDEFWRGVAEWYLETLTREPRRPVEAMATEHDASTATIRTWIRKARTEGWLTEGQQGRAGAEPGWKLIKYRQEMDAGRPADVSEA